MPRKGLARYQSLRAQLDGLKRQSETGDDLIHSEVEEQAGIGVEWQEVEAPRLG